MNYILKKALEMAAVLEKVSDFFLFKSNRILHLLGCLIGSALLGWEFGVGGNIEPVPASAALHIFDFSRQSCADAKFPAE